MMGSAESRRVRPLRSSEGKLPWRATSWLARAVRFVLPPLLVPLLLAFSVSTVHAWEYVFNPPPDYSWGEAASLSRIVVDGAGDVIACVKSKPGQYDTESVFVLKLSGKDGHLLWQHRINASANYRASHDCSALAVDRPGNVFVGGRFTVAGYDVFQFVLVKLAGGTGREIWSRYLGDMRDSLSSALRTLAVDAEGNVVAAGRIDAAGYGDTVIKFDGGTGGEIWRVPAEAGDSYQIAQAVALDSRGDSLIATATYLSTSYAMLHVRKLSGGDGSETWHFQQLRPRFGSVALSLDTPGDAVVSDTTSILKLSGTTGVVQWVLPLPATQVSVSANGNVIATLTGGAGVAGLRGSSGEILWRRTGDPTLTYAASSPDPAGDPGATGTAIRRDPTEMFLLKLAGTTGRVLWRRTFSDEIEASGQAVTSDAAGDIIAAGHFTSTSTWWDEPFEDDKVVILKVWGPTGADYPPSAPQILAVLADTIIGLALPRPLEYSLLRDVRSASTLLADGDPANDSGAADSLRLLIRRVTAQRGKMIPAAGADEILTLASQALAALGEAR